MGHRALVAYERADGRYDCHRSQWGGADLALRHRVTADRPFGRGSDGWGPTVRGRLSAGASFEAATDGVDLPPEPPPVDPRPVARRRTLAEVVAGDVDYLGHEAVYLVSAGFRVTAARPLWYGLECESERVARSPADAGALVRVGPDGADDADLWAWFRGARRAVAVLVDRGDVTETAAVEALDRAVREAFDDDVLGTALPE